MATRFLVILVCFFLGMVMLTYMFHIASQPVVYRSNPSEATLGWTGDPDVQLNSASVHKLNEEIKQLLDQEYPGAPTRFVVVPLGKRRIELKFVGAAEPGPSVRAKVAEFLEKRLPEVAKEQEK